MSFPTYTGISGSTLFYGEDPDATIAPVFGAFLGLHLGKLGVQVEAMLDFDWATDYWGRDISGLSLFVPLIVKYDIRLGDFSIQPLAGAYYNIALGDIKINDDSVPSANPPIGIMAGSAFGWNFRKGLLFLDARFAWNLGKTVVSYGYGDSQSLWHKSAFILALGYEFN
jgi:hypothetical protein